ncbi:MAG: hypothetical protein JKP92_05905 [Alphaproteobacteria bacterium]|nr:hypothetical protein [Alphaproteobacteria bacterium]
MQVAKTRPVTQVLRPRDLGKAFSIAMVCCCNDTREYGALDGPFLWNARSDIWFIFMALAANRPYGSGCTINPKPFAIDIMFEIMDTLKDAVGEDDPIAEAWARLDCPDVPRRMQSVLYAIPETPTSTHPSG